MYYKTAQLQTQSLRPIQQIALDMEQLRLAQAICVARQFCELRQMCATCVDGSFFQPAKCQLNACTQAFANITYADPATVHMTPQSRGRKHLGETQLQPNPRKAKVYEFEMVAPEAEAKQRFDADYALPVVEGTLCVEPALLWTDHPGEKAMELVLAPKFVFVQGWPGRAGHGS